MPGRHAGDPFYNSPYWREIRAIILERDHYTCVIPGCHQPAHTVDHIRSRYQGGDESASNLRSLCKTHDLQLKEQKNGRRGRNGVPTSICNLAGYPTDPKHPWNRRRI